MYSFETPLTVYTGPTLSRWCAPVDRLVYSRKKKKKKNSLLHK